MSSGAAVHVPETLAEALSPRWLTAALGARFPGVEVTDVEVGPVDERVTTNARFRITCAGRVPEGLPESLCVKGYFSEYARAGRAVSVKETCFYRDALPAIGVATLRPVWCDVDPETSHGVLITQDVIAAGGRFLDAASPYSPDMAATILSDLATLHARTWCVPREPERPWLRTDGMASRLRVRGEAEIRSNFEGLIGAGIPEQVRDPLRLLDAYRAMAHGRFDEHPWCVIHGDTHPGNVFIDATGRPALLDWQLVQCANWFHDVGCHLAAALTVEDRRAHELDLLQHYLAELRLRGVDAPSLGEARQRIAGGILLGFFLWAITVRVAPTITTELLTRLGTAALDHGALP